LRSWLTCLLGCLSAIASAAPIYALPPQLQGGAKASDLSLFRIDPKRVVWTSGDGVKNAERLLHVERGQAMLKESGPVATLKPGRASSWISGSSSME